MNYNGGLSGVTVNVTLDDVESYVDGQTIPSERA
jgi:hypothetical protein